MARNLTGLKIRALRRKAGLTQSALAARVGISASYLNLIEANKRAAAGAVLVRLGNELGITPSELDGLAERRLIESLEEIAIDPGIGGEAPRPHAAEDLVARNPEWAEFILGLYRAFHDQSQAVQALADRLNRDPFVGESVHRMLTSATAISSAAEILGESDDLTAADRERFLAIIEADGTRLSQAARSLLDFFDSSSMRVRSATSMEHVDAFIFHSDNYFPELEAIADRQGGAGGGERPPREMAEHPSDAAQESIRFEAARTLARNLASDEIDAIVGVHPALPTEEARDLARSALISYVAGAILMPYDRFLAAAEECRYDIDLLARRFWVSYEQAAHRVATLRRPGAAGVRFAYMRSDVSGYVTKRLPLANLPLPRYGTACPMWPIYGAFQAPGTTMRSFGALPSGDNFLFFARAVEKQPARVDRPRKLLSIMLACPAADASRVLYGDGIDASRATMPVGTVCRLCPREACGHRQEEPLIAGPRSP
ncbi:helix-turn-helix domain-containing protein [Chelativorans sp. AA-79]|uniref:helix-turn-helix domain-containing protein n=1 Tax=Chelativorans sp. AA-79 TaxID=3028735 RepID=UPI0023F713E5|nr:helix-turn-helix domain-containing protein [Chelativorans sp. AA-79]WEX10646.1 short-chain fatty acyl-CoA regulator family protein [Chelativorans sp. AA-79]